MTLLGPSPSLKTFSRNIVDTSTAGRTPGTAPPGSVGTQWLTAASCWTGSRGGTVTEKLTMTETIMMTETIIMTERRVMSEGDNGDTELHENLTRAADCYLL